jgi:hypothetical protein
LIKRISDIIIVVLLVASTSGITVYKHYCGSYLAKQSIFFKPHDCCKGPCKKCHTEGKQLKVTDDFESQSLNLKAESSNLKSQIPFVNLPFNVYSSEIQQISILNSKKHLAYLAYCKPEVCPLSLKGALRL